MVIAILLWLSVVLILISAAIISLGVIWPRIRRLRNVLRKPLQRKLVIVRVETIIGNYYTIISVDSFQPSVGFVIPASSLAEAKKEAAKIFEKDYPIDVFKWVEK